MSITATEIQAMIQAGLPNAIINVQGDDGVHFSARVICQSFQGKLPLVRHRMVYATLGEKMGREIHALELKTLTLDEQQGAS
jgi:acid stress-induced BolA-like protein IbaG/YrbA